jgi:EF-P beta-lysylation protein EpmB
MVAGNPRDPLLLQVLAVADELTQTPGFVADPLQENQTNLMPGLIHKYQGRVLVTLTPVCAVHCRYCFRRHFPYQENTPGPLGRADLLNYIASNVSIHEVIFSGGDPLLAKDSVLRTWLNQLSDIPHVKTVRFHTRIPIVLPERIDSACLNLLAEETRLNKVIVLHSNHPQELDHDVERACKALKEAGCHLLNQSVLMRGINDSADVLVSLSERLFDCGVLPYYLHLLDKVLGAAHFDVPLHEARLLFEAMQARLPGYLVPRLTREEPGKAHKTIYALDCAN